MVSAGDSEDDENEDEGEDEVEPIKKWVPDGTDENDSFEWDSEWDTTK